MRKLTKIMAVVLCVFVAAGCAANSNQNSQPAQSGGTSTDAGAGAGAAEVKRTEIQFWHDWGGDEEKQINGIIEKYNQSQDKYTLVGLVSGDVQKIKVAIAGGAGPEVFTDYSANMAAYAEEGIVENLDSLIARDGISFGDYIPSVLGTMTYNGHIYAISHEPTIMMLYYNKKMLSAAGYDAPPATAGELMDIAIATTKVDTDGTIIDLGFPDYPFVYYAPAFSAAFGGKSFDDSGKYTPDNQGMLDALHLIIDYRQKYGLDKVIQFNDSGKYCDPSDPFFTGHQALRIDGAWLAMLSNEYGIDKDICDFGVAPCPYPDGKPELARGAELSSGLFLMSVNAKNKDGGWDFLKWVHEGNWALERKCFPAQKSLLTNSAYDTVQNFSDFAGMASSPNLIAQPMNPKSVELGKILSDQLELAVTMKASPEDAMAKAAEDGNKLLGN